MMGFTDFNNIKSWCFFKSASVKKYNGMLIKSKKFKVYRLANLGKSDTKNSLYT